MYIFIAIGHHGLTISNYANTLKLF